VFAASGKGKCDRGGHQRHAHYRTESEDEKVPDAHRGLRMVVRTKSATAAEPARPWTTPTTSGLTSL
jgi:hypothetical protein